MSIHIVVPLRDFDFTFLKFKKVAGCSKPRKDGGHIPLAGLVLAHTRPLNKRA